MRLLRRLLSQWPSCRSRVTEVAAAVLIAALATSVANAQQIGVNGVQLVPKALSAGGAFTSPLLGPSATDCTAGTITYSFSGDTDTGATRTAANTLVGCAGATQIWKADTSGLRVGLGSSEYNGSVYDLTVVGSTANGSARVAYAVGNTAFGEWHTIATDGSFSWTETGVADGRFSINKGGGISLDAAVFLYASANDVLDMRRGTNPQTFNLYNTYTDAANSEVARFNWQGDKLRFGTTRSGTGLNRAMLVGPEGDQTIGLMTSGTERWQVGNDAASSALLAIGNYNIGNGSGSSPVNLWLEGPAVTAPTDATAVDAGSVTRLRSTSTITPATGGAGNCGTAFAAAALTADCTIATLPAGMQLKQVYADVTAGFTCSGTCTGTKVVQCGTAAGGTQVLAAGFTVAATGQAGDADAELGSGMTRAAAIQGGLIGSWSGTTPISCRFTSGTGNWGDGAATFVNAGSIKFFLITEQIK